MMRSIDMVRFVLTDQVKSLLRGEFIMWTRSILTVVTLAAATPVLAAELRPDEARHFIAGKHFSYTCFEGTQGSGRINADGSVVGTIQIRGSGPVRFVTLPVGTIRVQQDSICASVRGMLFQPCFAVNQIDAHSFRGSLSAFRFAYCDFTRRNPRLEIQATQPRPESDDVMRASVNE
jgi:hypothetical protein